LTKNGFQGVLHLPLVLVVVLLLERLKVWFEPLLSLFLVLNDPCHVNWFLIFELVWDENVLSSKTCSTSFDSCYDRLLYIVLKRLVEGSRWLVVAGDDAILFFVVVQDVVYNLVVMKELVGTAFHAWILDVCQVVYGLGVKVSLLVVDVLAQLVNGKSTDFSMLHHAGRLRNFGVHCLFRD
jgi:hypothetical protein